MRNKRASPKEFEAITDKELRELSELEAKATPGKLLGIRPETSLIEQDEYGADILDDGDWIRNDLTIEGLDGENEIVDMTDEDEKLYCALRNNAKEIIAELIRTRTESESHEHEPGEIIADVGCAACGKTIRIQYGDDPGEIGSLYIPSKETPE